jgi:hypothetical protein
MAIWYRELACILGIRSMTSRRPIAAVVALALCGVSFTAYAADTPGVRSVEERPFGGPPPMRRSMDRKAWGTTCKAKTDTCKLAKSQQVGSDCSCPGKDGKSVTGKVEESK